MAMGVLRKHGVVTEGPDPAGGRFKVTRLTARGVVAPRRVPRPGRRHRADWRTRFGDATVTALRQALEPLRGRRPAPALRRPRPVPGQLARPGCRRPATLPHYPMTLHRGGYPDGS